VKNWFLRTLFAVALTASASPTVLLAQTADYNKVIAQAKADLAAGRNAEALAGSQKAIQIDTSRWEAYLVAGSALESQKQFDPAIANYTKALERAPEPKKDAVRGLLEQCKKLSASSIPAVAAQATTAQSPTFKETLDWLISKNAQGGFSMGIAFPGVFDSPQITRFHTDFDSNSDGVQCSAALQGGAEENSGPQAGQKLKGSDWDEVNDNHLSIHFASLAPNSIGVKRVNVRNLMPPPQGEQVLSFSQEVYFQITGLYPFWENWEQLSEANRKQLAAQEAAHGGIDFTTDPRAPVYSDQDLANRVAKALNHAIDVCGGKGKPEAF
jgi:tetratricopeptide (TPR) repeat protein